MDQLFKKFKLGVEHIRIPIGDDIYSPNDVDYIYVGKQIEDLFPGKIFGFYKLVSIKFIGVSLMSSSMEQLIIFKVKYNMVPRKYDVKEKCIVRLRQLRRHKCK